MFLKREDRCWLENLHQLKLLKSAEVGTRLNTTGGVSLPGSFDAEVCRNLRSGENFAFALLIITFGMMILGFGTICCCKSRNHTPPQGNLNPVQQPLLAAQQQGGGPSTGRIIPASNYGSTGLNMV